MKLKGKALKQMGASCFSAARWSTSSLSPLCFRFSHIGAQSTHKA